MSNFGAFFVERHGRRAAGMEIQVDCKLPQRRVKSICA